MTLPRPTTWPATIRNRHFDDPADLDDTPVDADYDRLTYRLTFAATNDRTIFSGGVNGPDLPNAYTNGTNDAPGDWSADIDDFDQDPVFHVLGSAVGECIHEALEWAQLDGKPILDPHGTHESKIHDLVQQLNVALFELAKDNAPSKVPE